MREKSAPPLLKKRGRVTDYQKMLTRLGWSQVKAAKWLGINPRTSRRYASGEIRTPEEILMTLFRQEPNEAASTISRVTGVGEDEYDDFED